MKTLVIAFVAFCTLSLVSCGGGKSACDCFKEAMDLTKKTMEDPSNAEKYNKQLESLKSSCDKYKMEDFKDCK
jgi:hypothetical protein